MTRAAFRLRQPWWVRIGILGCGSASLHPAYVRLQPPFFSFFLSILQHFPVSPGRFDPAKAKPRNAKQVTLKYMYSLVKVTSSARILSVEFIGVGTDAVNGPTRGLPAPSITIHPLPTRLACYQ